MANSSLFLPNCNPLTDFPRPTAHKTVEIGGITVSSDKDVLDEVCEWCGGTRILLISEMAKHSRSPFSHGPALVWISSPSE